MPPTTSLGPHFQRAPELAHSSKPKLSRSFTTLCFCKARAIESFEAQAGNELDLTKSSPIFVEGTNGVWGFGTCTVSSKRGWFPLSTVKIVKKFYEVKTNPSIKVQKNSKTKKEKVEDYFSTSLSKKSFPKKTDLESLEVSSTQNIRPNKFSSLKYSSSKTKKSLEAINQTLPGDEMTTRTVLKDVRRGRVKGPGRPRARTIETNQTVFVQYLE